MPSIATFRAGNATYAPSYLPVAIFVSGTSGIGRATAEAFARYTSGNAHIILIGRSAAAANTIVTSFPKPPPLPCRNGTRICAALLARLPRVHFLFLSAGYFSFVGRDDTAEGSTPARAAGEPASVLSVLGAGHGPAVDLQDLCLVKEYSGKAAMDASATYTDLMVEEFAERNPEIAFTHTFPGFANFVPDSIQRYQ
ncbi:hypothetical protein DFH09DRAFT_1104500 [Mycena vulgaris]|nr:hypothetical protein DFH09DRAFT_1104500 [Mycena vulgaris]